MIGSDTTSDPYIISTSALVPVDSTSWKRLLRERVSSSFGSAVKSLQVQADQGAPFPIFAAFRNCVAFDEAKGKASWIGGYAQVVDLWGEIGPELVRETAAAIKETGCNPDVLGKNRNHWPICTGWSRTRCFGCSLKGG
jgi:hypothetical protein